MELFEKVQYSHNQVTKNSLNEDYTAYVNKWSFTVKIKLCAFLLTKTFND